METRVDRYASYRAEIEKMSEDEESTKSKSSKVVSSLLKDEEINVNQTLNLTDALKPYEFYKEEEKVDKPSKRKLGIAGKRIIIYSIVASSVILTLLIILVVVGIILFS